MKRTRLSMKLLWQLRGDFMKIVSPSPKYIDDSESFLHFVDEQIKSFGERQQTPTTKKSKRSQKTTTKE